MVEPWRVLSSRQLVSDKWITVRADHCVTPGGRDIVPYYLLTFPDWVHVVALTEEDELILVEQYRHGVGESCLELPGGMVDGSETDPLATARRELEEETGFAAAEWRLVSSLYVNPGRQNNRFHTVLATGCRCVGTPSLDVGEEGLVVHRKKLATLMQDPVDANPLYIAHFGALMLALAALGRWEFKALSAARGT